MINPDVKEYCELFIFYLLSGPFKVNGCPLRRVNQRFVVATSTSIDLSGVKVPEKIDDAYFRRARKEKKGAAKKEGDIFEAKKESYKVGLYYSTEISIRKLTCSSFDNIRLRTSGSRTRSTLTSWCLRPSRRTRMEPY